MKLLGEIVQATYLKLFNALYFLYLFSLSWVKSHNLKHYEDD